MKKKEREEKELILQMFTGWNISIFENMSDDELLKIYDERVANRPQP